MGRPDWIDMMCTETPWVAGALKARLRLDEEVDGAEAPDSEFLMLTTT
jgi:hypothetical protein